ncbi:hypothetical protein MP228_011372 [Amoeboaphelidium protococcarum]|nr:hypothetical protein MP228_011372 [Amoeboaphelidium protococcarum]
MGDAAMFYRSVAPRGNQESLVSPSEVSQSDVQDDIHSGNFKDDDGVLQSTEVSNVESVISIAHSVCGKINTISVFNDDVRLSSFMSPPKQHHWNEVNRVFQYLRSTMDLCIQFRRLVEVPQQDGVNCSVIEIEGLSDSDFAQDTYDRKSIAGSVFKNLSVAVSRQAKKFPTVAKSTIDAEYNALSNRTSEAVFFSGTLFMKSLGDGSVQGKVLKIIDQSGTFRVTKWCEVKGCNFTEGQWRSKRVTIHKQTASKFGLANLYVKFEYQTQAYVEDLYYILQVSLKSDWLTKQQKFANPHIGQTSIKDWCTID